MMNFFAIKKTISIFYLFLLILIGINCRRLPAEKTYFVFEDSLSAIVDSFLQEYPNKSIYELYIDKKNPYKSVLMLFGGDRSRTLIENTHNRQVPIIKVLNQGKVIYVYSGAERYIYQKNEIINAKIIAKSTVSRRSCENERCWVIIDHYDTLKIIKDYDVPPYPFIKLPLKTINFKPPIIQSPKINQNPDTTNK